MGNGWPCFIYLVLIFSSCFFFPVFKNPVSAAAQLLQDEFWTLRIKKKLHTPKKGKKKQRKSPCSKLRIYGFMFEFTVLMPQEVLLSVVQFKQERWWSMMHKQDSWHERRSKILWLTPPFQGKTILHNTSSVLYSKKQQWLQRLILRLRKNFEPAQ